MVYSIKDFPRLGHVVKLNNDSDSTASPVLDYIHSFTQEEINLGKILYVSASLQGRDHFTADVSNGFTSIEDLEVQVDIVPRIIPVQVVNLTVREGGSVALTQDILNITHPFYRSINIDFLMEEAPQHGDIKYLDEEDRLDTFTWEDVSANTYMLFTKTIIVFIHISLYFYIAGLFNLLDGHEPPKCDNLHAGDPCPKILKAQDSYIFSSIKDPIHIVKN